MGASIVNKAFDQLHYTVSHSDWFVVENKKQKWLLSTNKRKSTLYSTLSICTPKNPNWNE